MTTTAIDTAGTTKGVELEMKGRLSRSERNAVHEALNKGFLVPLEGLHTDGYYGDCSVLMRRSNHPDVEAAATEYRHGLYRLENKGWKKKLRDTGNLPVLGNGGEQAIAIVTAIATVLGWRGPLEDSTDTMTDLSETDGEKVRLFLRAHYLPEWAVSSKQKDLPQYDSNVVDVEFLEMLNRANGELDADPLAVHRHIVNPATSSTPFVVSHEGIFKGREEAVESES